jgi:hypothetical protein
MSTIPADDYSQCSMPGLPQWNVGLNDVTAQRFITPIDTDIWTIKDHNGVSHGSNAPDAEEKLRAIFEGVVEALNDPKHPCHARGRRDVILECNFLPVVGVGFPLWGDKPEVKQYKPVELCRGPLGQARRVMWYSGPYRWEPGQVEGVDPEKALSLTPGWDAYEKDQQIPELAALLPAPLGLVRNGETWAIFTLEPGKADVMIKDMSLIDALLYLHTWTNGEAEEWSAVRRRIHPIRDWNIRAVDVWHRQMKMIEAPWAY